MGKIFGDFYILYIIGMLHKTLQNPVVNIIVLGLVYVLSMNKLDALENNFFWKKNFFLENRLGIGPPISFGFSCGFFATLLLIARSQ